MEPGRWDVEVPILVYEHITLRPAIIDACPAYQSDSISASRFRAQDRARLIRPSIRPPDDLYKASYKAMDEAFVYVQFRRYMVEDKRCPRLIAAD